MLDASVKVLCVRMSLATPSQDYGRFAAVGQSYMVAHEHLHILHFDLCLYHIPSTQLHLQF